MARRGFFRRILDIFRPSKPAPKPEPTTGSIGPSPPPINSLRRQAINRIAALNTMSNKSRIGDGVKLMTRDELQWTVNATDDQIRAKAKKDADRVLVNDDGSLVPRNPWWYR